ncbi:MAG: hypothetical protein ACRC4W_00495 [Treponemataceae bacterium]
MEINLDTSLCENLRNTVNKYGHYSFTKTSSIKGDSEQTGWKKICAIMDRLCDTTLYLNSLDIEKTDSRFCVFDFYNFVNHSATLIDCIKYLAEIYQYDLSEQNTRTNIFNEKGSDKSYFEYLRSLCSVHPIDTSRHKKFKDSQTTIECCPYTRFQTSLELVAIVYSANPKSFSKRISIKLNKIYEYVTYRYNLLNEIISCIHKYNEKIKSDYKSQPLKKVSDFNDYNCYLEYLEITAKDRLGSEYEKGVAYFQKFFKYSFNSKKN